MAKRSKTSLIIIIVLGFFVLNLAFPQYVNKVIDTIKPKVSNIPVLKRLPRFPDSPFKYGLDLQGGSQLVYEAHFSSDIASEERGEVMKGLRDVIERRVQARGSHGLGVTEPIVATQEVAGILRLVIELPGVKDVNRAIDLIGTTPYLEFKEERSEEASESIIKEYLEEDELEQAGAAVLCTSGLFVNNFIQAYEQDPCYQSANLTGQYLKKAGLVFDQLTSQVQVNIEFNDEGAKIFKELTTANIGKRLAIFIDSILISAPNVREAIPNGKAQITGDFSRDEAAELARNLNAGALPVPITLLSQISIGPTLGAISLNKSLVAGIFGLGGTVLFMLIFYRLPGALASLALLIYVGILLTLFKFIPVTLTLAGIGGAILSVGMAVDANILIFERFKEEREEGENFPKAVEAGFARAWPSIRDSNLTTLLVGLIMFGFGSSFIKGFALTLSLGILVSMFSAMFVTRTFLRLFANTRLENIKWLWQ